MTQDQSARLKGTVDGAASDHDVVLANSILHYKLNNGANFWMLNIVKRLPLTGIPGERWSIAGLAKAGGGIMTPHTQNTLFSHDNNPGFQFGGWLGGLEAGFRFTLFKPFYLELTDKIVRANYSGVHIYQGTASHSFWANEVILSLGTAIHIGR